VRVGASLSELLRHHFGAMIDCIPYILECDKMIDRLMHIWGGGGLTISTLDQALCELFFWLKTIRTCSVPIGGNLDNVEYHDKLHF